MELLVDQQDIVTATTYECLKRDPDKFGKATTFIASSFLYEKLRGHLPQIDAQDPDFVNQNQGWDR
jgi:hypothetical protein